MSSPEVAMRGARQDDSPDLFEWRNDPHTRSVSLSTAEVSWEDHERWFETTLANQHRHIYIGELVNDIAETVAVGMVRFDCNENDSTAEVSINLNPNMRGQGLGYSTLSSGIASFWGDAPEVLSITARIRDTNAASIAIFQKAGFTLAGASDGVSNYQLRRPTGQSKLA